MTTVSDSGSGHEIAGASGAFGMKLLLWWSGSSSDCTGPGFSDRTEIMLS